MASKNAISDKILKAIEIAIKRSTEGLTNNFIKAIVKSVGTDHDYLVTVNGSDYTMQSGCGLVFEAGDPVWVHIPNGNYKNAYISASVGYHALPTSTT